MCKTTRGSAIIQNWETSKNISDDIRGDMLHFPVLVDRNKKFQFDKDKIIKEGKYLIKSILKIKLLI